MDRGIGEAGLETGKAVAVGVAGKDRGVRREGQLVSHNADGQDRDEGIAALWEIHKPLCV
jgi:hypothetical protein